MGDFKKVGEFQRAVAFPGSTIIPALSDPNPLLTGGWEPTNTPKPPEPTQKPTIVPTVVVTDQPTVVPTSQPTIIPTVASTPIARTPVPPGFTPDWKPQETVTPAVTPTCICEVVGPRTNELPTTGSVLVPMTGAGVTAKCATRQTAEYFILYTNSVPTNVMTLTEAYAYSTAHPLVNVLEGPNTLNVNLNEQLQSDGISIVKYGSQAPFDFIAAYMPAISDALKNLAAKNGVSEAEFAETVQKAIAPPTTRYSNLGFLDDIYGYDFDFYRHNEGDNFKSDGLSSFDQVAELIAHNVLFDSNFKRATSIVVNNPDKMYVKDEFGNDVVNAQGGKQVDIDRLVAMTARILLNDMPWNEAATAFAQNSTTVADMRMMNGFSDIVNAAREDILRFATTPVYITPSSFGSDPIPLQLLANEKKNA